MEYSSVYPFVSIIIPVFNGEKYLKECLECLVKQKYPKDRFEIIIVDNNSNDNTASIAKSFNIVYIFFNAKQSAPASRNAGIIHAKGEILLFIDADCLASENLVLLHAIKHLYFRYADKSVMAVGGGVKGINKSLWAICDDVFSWFRYDYRLPQRMEKRFIPTANLSFISEVFNKIGNFNEDLFYADDLEICQRIIANGGKIFFQSAAYVSHINRTSFKDFKKHIYDWSSGHDFMLKSGLRKPMKFFTIYYLLRSGARFFITQYYCFISRRLLHLLLFPFIIMGCFIDYFYLIRSEHKCKKSKNNFKKIKSILPKN